MKIAAAARGARRRTFSRCGFSPIAYGPSSGRSARRGARALVCRAGTGRRRDAYRYWLPQKEAQMQSDLRRQLDELHRAQLAALDPEVRHRAELESAAWNAQREVEERQAEE